jgi:hypothetical protein
MSLDTPVGGGFLSARPLLAAPAASVPVGTQFEVPVYARISGGQVNAIRTDVSYPANLMTFDSSAPNSSVWNATAANSGSDGTVDVQVGSATGQSGTVLMATLTFTATAPGTATLSFDSTAWVVDATDTVDTVVSTQGATYTITP